MQMMQYDACQIQEGLRHEEDCIFNVATPRAEGAIYSLGGCETAKPRLLWYGVAAEWKATADK